MISRYFDDKGDFIKLTKAQQKQLSRAERKVYKVSQRVASGAPDISLSGTAYSDIKSEVAAKKLAAESDRIATKISAPPGQARRSLRDGVSNYKEVTANDERLIRENAQAKRKIARAQSRLNAKRSTASANARANSPSPEAKAFTRSQRSAPLRAFESAQQQLSVAEDQLSGLEGKARTAQQSIVTDLQSKVKTLGEKAQKAAVATGEAAGKAAGKAAEATGNTLNDLKNGSTTSKISGVIKNNVNGAKAGYAGSDARTRFLNATRNAGNDAASASKEASPVLKKTGETLSDLAKKGKTLAGKIPSLKGVAKGAAKLGLKGAPAASLVYSAYNTADTYKKNLALDHGDKQQALYDTALNAADDAAFGLGNEIAGGITGGAKELYNNGFGNVLNAAGKGFSDARARDAALADRMANLTVDDQGNVIPTAQAQQDQQGATDVPFQGSPQANPQTQVIPGTDNFVAPVGPGSNNIYGRTAANQAQIDNRVAQINKDTAAIRGGQRNSGLSPEQAQIVRLAKSIRSGHIGDKYKNNAINQKIAALQGVSNTNAIAGASKANTMATLLARQQQLAANARKQANIDTTAEAALANDPTKVGQLGATIAAHQASNSVTPTDRSLLKQQLGQVGNGALDSVYNFFTDAQAPNPSNPSFKGYGYTGGGGWLGGLIGLNQGITTPSGDTLRKEDMTPSQWRNALTATERDNPDLYR